MERDQNLGKPPSQIQRNDLKRYRCCEGKWWWDKREALVTRLFNPIQYLPPNPDNWKLSPFSAPKRADNTSNNQDDAKEVDKGALIF